MMITILKEVTIEMGECGERSHPFWLVEYDEVNQQVLDDWEQILCLFARCCGKVGWILVQGDDPYRERSLTVQDGSFSSPDTEAIKAWETEHWEELEE